jgi:hypothetical protein
MAKVTTALFLMMMLISVDSIGQLNGTANPIKIHDEITLRVLPQNFYTKHLSFFCKNELQLQKVIPLNMFFRLGSKDYVDFLERKPSTTFLNKLP